MQGEVNLKRFEVIESSQAALVWDALSKQGLLAKESLKENVQQGNEVWGCGFSDEESKNNNDVTNKNRKPDLFSGFVGGNNKQDDTLVFKSDVKVSKLSDDALRMWMATFL